MAAATKGREAKQAEKEAEAIVKSLQSAGEAAVATTLAGITKKLKENRPLMYHISALLHNEEWSGVLIASALGMDEDQKDQASPCGDKPALRKLRVGVKTFANLQRTLSQGP